MLKKYMFIIFILVITIFLMNNKSSSLKKQVIINKIAYKQANLKVTSGNYIISNSFIKSIDIETNKEKFLTSFKVEEGNSKLVCDNETDYIGTNCNLQVTDENNSSQNYYLIVHGDVTGDGKSTITDLYKIATYKEEDKSLEGSYKEAADIDGDNKISIEDAKKLAHYTVEKQKIPVPSNIKRENVINIPEKNITVLKNESKTIKAYLTYSDVSILSWTSSDPTIAKVDTSGKVLGVNKGSTTIIVIASNGDTASVSINVDVLVPVTGISLNKTALTLNVDSTEKLIATVSPTDAANKKVIWTSSDNSIATVTSDGTIKALNVGTVTITATSEDGNYKDECKLTVNVPVTGINLNKTTLNLNKGASEKLTATITPNNASNQNKKWTSSTPSVGTVEEDGTVTAISAGTTVITVESIDGKYKSTCNVEVKDPDLYITPTISKIEYKTNFSSTRTGAVMQSWTADEKYIYIAQRNGSIDATNHYPAGFITRILKTSIKNNTYVDFSNSKYNGYLHLERFGHMTSLNIEKTNGTSYLWTGCNDIESDDESSADAATNLCRINLSNITFNKTLYTKTFGTKYVGKSAAIDSKERIIALRSGNRTTSTYTIYDLDDFIANNKVGGSGAKVLYTFKVSNSSNKMEDGTSKTDISWQGFAVYNNHIYIYEGNPQSNDTKGTYVSVWSFKGEKKVYRKNIGYPGTANWEPEGIQVYENLDNNTGAYIYVGYTNKDTSPTRHYIYRLSK